MKQIISFEKEIAFKTMIGEITKISLEDTLNFVNDSTIEGDLVVSGKYKMTEASALEDDFSYRLPVDIMLSSDLEEERRKINIDKFSYDVINEEILHIYVDVLVEGIEKIEIDEDVKEVLEVREIEEEKEEEVVLETREEKELKSEEEVINSKELVDKIDEVEEIEELIIPVEEEIEEVNEIEEVVPVMNSIFSAFSNTPETYTTYSVHILRENDTVEEILNKYSITKEELVNYNDLEELKVGTKLIIPTTIKNGE